MKRNKTIRINLLYKITAVPNDAAAIDKQRKKEEALKTLCDKLNKKYEDDGKKVDIKIVPYYEHCDRRKADYEIFLIDNEQPEIIETEISNAIDRCCINVFVRIKDFLTAGNSTHVINLFVVCPKDSLSDEKKAISRLCDDLNEEYAKAKNGKRFKINDITYYNPENREEVSQDYIRNKADIVIFLVDDITEDENAPLVNNIKLAIERNNKFNKPEPVVFVYKDSKNDTEDSKNSTIEKTKKLLASGGWVPDPFENAADLLNKVGAKIERYESLYDNIKGEQKKSKARYYGVRITSLLSVLLATLIACFLLLRDEFESRQLLIMGGGSAINYIVDNSTKLKSKNDLNTMFWHYAAMPSGDSYGIIAEEVIKNYEGYKNHPYYPIVLSAQQAKEIYFLKTSSTDEFIKAGIVIGIYLGDDWLVAYGSKGVFENIKQSDKTIKATTLDSIIKIQAMLSPKDSLTSRTQPIAIYTTSEHSGTLNAYYDSVCDKSIINEYKTKCDSINKRHRFSDEEILPKTDNNNISGKAKSKEKWIALGSNYYHPKNEDMDSLTVLKKMEKNIIKPVYVYFMLYKNDNNKYILPRATKRFLETIHVNDAIINSIRYINLNDTIVFDNKEISEDVIINSSTILYDSFHNIIQEKQ